jgi:hypothetical protein
VGQSVKTLWSEPKDDSGSQRDPEGSDYSFRRGRHGKNFYEKVRRIVVIDPRDEHCICLPIVTYSDQVVNKGVHARDHTVIYTK